MDTTQPDPRTHLPLTPAVFHILLALAEGEKHGYAIMKAVEEMPGGQKLGPGTLYGAIKRLRSAGLLDELDERPDPALDDQRRRYYCLTSYGRRVAVAEAERLAGLVMLAERCSLLDALPVERA